MTDPTVYRSWPYTIIQRVFLLIGTQAELRNIWVEVPFIISELLFEAAKALPRSLYYLKLATPII